VLPPSCLSSAEAAEVEALLGAALVRLHARRTELRALLRHRAAVAAGADAAAVADTTTAAAAAEAAAATTDVGAVAVWEGAWPDYVLLRARLNFYPPAVAVVRPCESVEAVALAAHAALLARLALAAAGPVAVVTVPVVREGAAAGAGDCDGFFTRAPHALDSGVGRLSFEAVDFAAPSAAFEGAAELAALECAMQAVVAASAASAPLAAVKAVAAEMVAHVL
jgi:hypothetical protein